MMLIPLLLLEVIEFSLKFPLYINNLFLARSKYGQGTPLNLNPRRPLKDKTQRDWYHIQKIILQNLIKTARGVGGISG